MAISPWSAVLMTTVFCVIPSWSRRLSVLFRYASDCLIKFA